MSGWFGIRLILTLAAELDCIRGQKWNSEQVIIFQMVILQRVRLVTGAKNIFAWIDVQLNSWNSGAFDKIVCNSYAASVVYLGRDCKNQSADQHHCTLSNLVLLGKLCEAVSFFANRSWGGVYYPMKWHPIKRVLWRKPPRRCWQKNIRKKQSPLLYARLVLAQDFHFALILWYVAKQIPIF